MRWPTARQRSVADWNERGVRRIDGTAWRGEDRNLQSQLFLPAGADGPALLLHPNFAVIRRYNNSDRYALVVALLARAFEGRGGLVRDWPRSAGSLNREQTLELQTLLNGLGYDAGSADGLFGSNTRRAVRAFQTDQRHGRRRLPDRGAARSRAHARRRRAGAAARTATGSARSGVRELQRLLNRLGYDAGRADGVIGSRTRDAIRDFERARGMEVRGRATDVVLEAARAAAG